jgi:DNA-binding beta-propeller fold protein YncE
MENIIPGVIPPGEEPYAPGGVAVTPTGEIWVSDAANHRVILLHGNGEFERVIGSGAPSAEKDGFDTPAGLAIDRDGNLYVADSGNGVVKKFSPTGVYLAEFGTGLLELPTSVAVDEQRQVFVADEAAHVVSIFSANGSYGGSITEPGLSDPHRVVVAGDVLYVVDRLAGVFEFEAPQASLQ